MVIETPHSPKWRLQIASLISQKSKTQTILKKRDNLNVNKRRKSYQLYMLRCYTLN